LKSSGCATALGPEEFIKKKISPRNYYHVKSTKMVP
jgi:hypothetical protein